jgi:excisionase family DNA binding protein
MIGMENMLSISQAASLSGVGHSTVGYWVRRNKLRAHRVGNQYSIPVEELVLYLKSRGMEIPDELAGVDVQLPDTTAFTNCWQHFKGTGERHDCVNCLVFKNRVKICFTGKETGSPQCPTDCPDCKYYIETYLPKVQFINQISSPAAISKGLYLWGGNSPWVKLWGVEEGVLPGMGIEHIFHPDSLPMIIAGIKKRSLGDSSEPKSYSAFVKNDEKGKIAVQISFYGLDDPPEALLILAEPENG